MQIRLTQTAPLLVCLLATATACNNNSASNGSPGNGNNGSGPAGTASLSNTVALSSTGSAAADGRAMLTVAAVVTGADGKPVANAFVTFSGDRAHHRFTPVSSATDANGVATTQMVSTLSGNQNVAAASGSLHGSGAIAFAAAQACYGTLLLPNVPSPGIHDHTTALLAGDLNLDRVADVLLADSNMRVVYRYYGHGDGTFDSAVPTGIDPNGTSYYALDDYDRDGDIDIALAAPAYGYVAIHMGDGNGNFAAAQVTPIPGLSNGAFPADLNNDGFTDLVAPVNGNVVVSLVNDQHGNLSAAATFSAPGVVQVKCADLVKSANATQDLLYSTNANIVVAAGLGDGTFGATAVTASVQNASTMRLADVSGDGEVDILVNAVSPGLATYAYLGDGSGAFPASITFAGALQNAPVDVTGDGKVDFVMSVAGGLQVWAGSGDGNYTGTGALWPVPLGLAATAIADVNGDGLPDFLTANGVPVSTGGPYTGQASNNSLNIILTQKAVGFPTYGSKLLQYSGVTSPILRLADLNGDSHGDLLAFAGLPAGGAALSAFIATADGNFTSAGVVGVGINNPNGFVACDINHDGSTDLALVGDSNQVVFATGDGQGHFALASSANTTVHAQGIAAADFNGDHFDDVALAVPLTSASTLNNVTVLLNQNGNFPSAVTLNANASSNALVATDLTGDGHADIAISDPKNQNILLFTGTGDGNFTGPVPVASNANALTGITVYYLLALDVNADGLTDLVTFGAPSSTSGAASVPTAAVWLNRAHGVFDVQPSFGYSSSNSLGAPTFFDVNGDGFSDLLEPDFANSSIKLFFGNGDGSFQTQQEYETDQFDTFSAVAGDFNHDGAVDLVTAGADDVRVLLAQPCHVAAPVFFERYGCSESSANVLVLLVTGAWLLVRSRRLT